MSLLKRLSAVAAIIALSLTAAVPQAAFAADGDSTPSAGTVTLAEPSADTVYVNGAVATIKATVKNTETAPVEGATVAWSVEPTGAVTFSASTQQTSATGEATVTITGAAASADGVTITATATKSDASYGAASKPINVAQAELEWSAAPPASLAVGQSGASATAQWKTPEEAPSGAVITYSSSNTSVLTVASDGALTPVSGGTAVITATAKASASAQAAMAVLESSQVTVSVPKVELSPNSTILSLPPAGAASVTASLKTGTNPLTPSAWQVDVSATPEGAVTALPSSGTGTTIAPTISAVEAGTATVKFTATYGEEDYEETINVTVKSYEVTVTPSVGSVPVEGTTTLSATVDPMPTGGAMSYDWRIDTGNDLVALQHQDAAVVTVKGVKEGKAKLTLTVANTSATPAMDPVTISPIEITVTAAVPSTTPTTTASSVPSASDSDALTSASPNPSAETSSAPTLPPADNPEPPSAQPSSAPSASAASSAEPSAEPSSTPSAELSNEPSESPSSEPSGSASVEPSAPSSVEPSATPTSEPNTPAEDVPIEPAEDAPIDFEISDNLDGSGSVLTGIDVATDNAQTGANAVENLIDSMQVPEGQSVEILDAEGEPVPMGDPVATGMIVQVVSADGTVVSTTAIVVKGDVTGTGEMNLTQLVRLASAFVGDEPLTGAYLMAGDLAGDDGEITLTDLVRMAALYKASTEAA